MPIKSPIKKETCQIKLAVPTTRRKLHWNKRVTAKVTAKVSLENLVRNILNENKFWKRTFKKSVVWQ